MQLLRTQSRNRPFSYERLADGRIRLRYGQGFETRIAAMDIERLLTVFQGQTVLLGTSRDYPPEGSIGAWLQQNVTKTAVAAYLGPVLVHEGLAAWGPRSGKALTLAFPPLQ